MLDVLRRLEGRCVGLALADGSRIDDCQLVSVGRPPAATSIWIFHNGQDEFVGVAAIRDAWETIAA